MNMLYAAIVKCHIEGPEQFLSRVKVTFSLPAEPAPHPVDLELAAVREARRQGHKVSSVSLIERQGETACPV